jgi:hypothetical protein
MQESSPPHVFSPLWVISLFLGLSEITVTIAITQADGWVQGMLAIFAVAFPTLVAVVFFLILWHNNKVLYAPREFADGTTVKEFADAMARRTRREVGIVESAIRASSESLAVQLTELGADKATRDELIENVVTAARRTTVLVELDRITEPGDTLSIPVDETTTVQDLLDTVYFSISDKVDPYTYGSRWMLINTESGQTLDAIGPIAKLDARMYRRWSVPLADVGIEAGMRMAAYLI